jgi:hypothetical protein
MHSSSDVRVGQINHPHSLPKVCNLRPVCETVQMPPETGHSLLGELKSGRSRKSSCDDYFQSNNNTFLAAGFISTAASSDCRLSAPRYLYSFIDRSHFRRLCLELRKARPIGLRVGLSTRRSWRPCILTVFIISMTLHSFVKSNNF